MERKKIIELFRVLTKELNLKAKIRIIPLKRKIASISLETRILRLNSIVLNILNEEEIKFILLHELIHLKIKSKNHGELFYIELKKHYKKDIEEIESRIIKKICGHFKNH